MVLFAGELQAQDALEAGFKNPPVSARPHTWWHWMNGNVTKAGITADLEAMKRIGIGGAQIFNVDVGLPDGKTPMMSPQWQDAMQFAVKEAHRLGMDLCVHNGAGWSSSGGPWIKPEQGMQFLTWSETPVHGPSHFEGVLPQPKMRENFYRDIAVFAVRKPSAEEGAPLRLEGIGVKAAFERGDHQVPSDAATPEGKATPKDGVRLVSEKISPEGKLTWEVPEGDWTLLRFGYTPTGETNHPAPASGRGLECDKLSRAALDTHWAGMMGPLVQGAGPLAGKSLNNCLIDSYEVGTQNWSPTFREEFLKRRGYDPLPYLPTVSGRVVDSIQTSERFLWDLRRTICDLFADNYYGYLADLCHKNGLLFSTEPYGNGEFDNLQIGGRADIPMGEFWVGNGAIETTKLASAAGHTNGRQIIGAESFTADTPHARWTMDPYGLKALGDRVFSLGVNRYIFHRYAHQPWLDLKPGMTMGPWGTNLERTITWWEQGAAWMHYIARCQYLLQSGHFVADVLYFTGDDGPNDLPYLRGNLVPSGYDYDGCDATVLHKATVRDGWVVLPSGMRYRILVLPDSAWMTPETAHKIQELAEAGATIFGPKPSHSPSLQNYPNCDTEVQGISATVWGDLDGTTVTEHAVGKGRVVWGKPLKAILPALGIAPDCDASGNTERSFVWIHRAIADADLYFVANQRYRPQTLDVAFRITGKAPEIWHPDTGLIEPAPVWRAENGRTVVSLRFGPAESAFVVFRHPAVADHPSAIRPLTGQTAVHAEPKIEIQKATYEAVDGAGGADVTAKVAALVKEGVTEIEATNGMFGDPTPLHVKQLRVVYLLDGKPMQAVVGENDTLLLVSQTDDTTPPDFELVSGKKGNELRAWAAGDYEVTFASGLSIQVKSEGAKSLPLSGTWTLKFPPNLGAPPQVTLDHLISWTEHSNPGVKYFSGSADYETTFDAPADLFAKGRALYLDLGTVKNFAEVWINGVKRDVLWKPPFRLDVTGLVHPGRNTLRVRVTNLWPNRLIGDEQYPD
ncbi:MAG TPA: glycosyl hydrolase, partial [Chthonomonadaceae bacterium]|nr:glycosyl hydrolase [Chthonomonadaceae bacterium]